MSYKKGGDNMAKDFGPKPYVIDIEKETLDNENYRTTIWTGNNSKTIITF